MKNINDDKSQKATFSLVNLWKRYKLSQELNSLDERMLADIGASRGEIPGIIEAAYPRVRFMALAARLLDNWAKSRKNRIVAWELAGFDDRLLADIGLYRSDISAIAKGHYPKRHELSVSLMDVCVDSIGNTHAVNDDHRRAA